MQKILKIWLKLFTQLFQKKYLIYYFLACFLTFVLVFTQFDWAYFLFVMGHFPRSILFASDILGFVISIFLPVLFLIIYFFDKNDFRKPFSKILLKVTFYSITLGYVVSTIIKSFTGRVSPPDDFYGTGGVLVDNSHSFQFGFMREQVISGWPSSHATIIFALAISLSMLFPKNLKLQIFFFSVAFFVGLVVSLGFHWFSEFVAGALLGSVIGNIVGEHFKS